MSDVLKCEEKTCEKTIPNHAWGKIKADGWVQLKNGKNYCPDHKPEWYDKWKKSRPTAPKGRG